VADFARGRRRCRCCSIEQNLTDLGFGTDVVVDEEFDKYTTAIKAWQDSRGFKKTGVVNPGDA
jgi:hypothetical protein